MNEDEVIKNEIDGCPEFEWSLTNSEIKAIGDYKKILDDIKLKAIRIKLEEIGYRFDNDESFLKFCETGLEFIITQIQGNPLDRTTAVYLKAGMPVAVFDETNENFIPFGRHGTIKLRDDIKNVPLRNKVVDMKNKEKSIDKVTTDRLDMSLRCVGIQIDIKILDKIIDVIELLEGNGGDTTIENLIDLKMKWEEKR